ncbi:tail completion protein gp17 [Citromicrobium bathyomarinum]|uniref:tail completion protein gp17 n=1 Tax=Citromicrobium bathyomarinum TaxID=72174 RepID=UPI00315A5A1F
METALRSALIDHLRADTALMDTINLVDEAEIERAYAPWLALVASAAIDWSTKTHAGREVRVALELRLHGDDPATGIDIAGLVDARVLSLPAAQTGFRVVSAQFLRGQTQRRDRNARAILREYRFRILEHTHP